MPLLLDIKKLRQKLNLTQQDMEDRIGMKRQQYQKLESNGNPRLDTLELIATGLNSELLIIPKDKIDIVKKVLENKISLSNFNQHIDQADENYWTELFGSDDE